MILLNGSNIKKMFLDETLFDSVSFNVDSNDKIGFIGVNGAGKSTLFKIITGDMDYDEGEIFKNKGCFFCSTLSCFIHIKRQYDIISITL